MDTQVQPFALKPWAIWGFFLALSMVYVSSRIIFIYVFDPLRHVPGPKINALSRIPYIRHLLAGTTVDNVVDLHKRYGEAVRVSPNEVSFISGESAYPDIYGYRTGKLKGHSTMQKDPVWYLPAGNGENSILTADDESHSRGRRSLSYAFSAQALSEQEPLVQKYVDQLIDGLKEVASTSGKSVDMAKWYTWMAFDIIADLLFGEPFGCLQDYDTHKYIDLLYRNIESAGLIYIMTYFPWTKYLGQMVVDQEMVKSTGEYTQWIADQTRRRRERDTERSDFMTYILNHNGKKGESLTPGEMDSNASLFLAAGSETTATLLSGVTFLLLHNPDKMQKLKDEVRGRWKRYEDIKLDGVNNAPYLLAVLSEGLRYFPPVPTGFQRLVPKGGAMVSGYFLPENTGVCVSGYPAYHSERNFKDPDAFVPERWMGEKEYQNDNRIGCQPFSVGPRNCIGKNLAYAEMRLGLAKVIWSFDLELMPQSSNWMRECKVFTHWTRPELAVLVREVERS